MTQSKKYDPASLLEVIHYNGAQTAKHDAKIKQDWKLNRTGLIIFSRGILVFGQKDQKVNFQNSR